MMDKKELRKHIRTQVSTISEETRALLSKTVSLSIEKSSEWNQAKTVLLFSSLPDEIDMSYLIADAVRSSKRVVLPVVKGDDLKLYFYDPSKMQAGAFSILEPTSDSDPANPNDIDFAIIPGRAFTKEGKRLGRGKGFYDRLLPLLRCPAWGICYPCQIVEEIAMDPWDILLDGVFFA